MEFRPKSGVNADSGKAQSGRKPAEDMQLSAAMHLCALVAMVVLFAAMLAFKGC